MIHLILTYLCIWNTDTFFVNGWGCVSWHFELFITMGSPIIHVVYPKGTLGTTSHRVAKQELEHYSVGGYVSLPFLFFLWWGKLPNYANRCTFGSTHCWLNMREEKASVSTYIIPQKWKPTFVYSNSNKSAHHPSINNPFISIFQDE